MDSRSEVRDFLASRRARVTPEQAGLRVYGGLRRVPGLRREEVAMLAGVSVDYYTRLERGNLAGVSDQVLDALSRALQLDDAEREHLEHLARAAGPARAGRARRRPASTVRPVVQRILDSMHGTPAFVRNGRLDVLGANALGEALYSEMYADPSRPVNHARFNFLNPAARRFWGDWDRAAYDTVAILRAEAGRDPYDRDLTALVGELSTRSEEFRRLWASHDVKHHDTGVKTFVHPVVGRLDLAFESLDLAADSGLTVLAYSAEPGSPADDGLKMLASWAATRRTEQAAADGRG
ncbi:helix-turn-helix transcriptional regulator [Cellulomonas endometrii]|uniref:helix-turn-helix transcriptional regulator n=1 Tax=Cellulomonas endometrii TaxID=3036301 RepID=UPI0024AD27AA|nr:helix-turn-helix transcriptional regulator [Cellulomonas endometrii]